MNKILKILLIGLVLITLDFNSRAAEIREATDLIRGSISSLDAYSRQYDGKNFWIFTAPDSNGIKQVFYQWSDSSTAFDATSPTAQLTFNSVDASNAKFGSEVNDLHYAATAADPLTVCEGVVFYYLADTDVDLANEIHMGCIAYPNMATEPTTVNFDVKLTGYDSATNFDVKDYDVSRAGRATTVNIYANNNSVDSYPVVFTDSSNALHMLMFSKSTIYGNSDNISGSTPPIVYDYSDNSSFIYVWNSTTINTGAKYFTPKLDPWANNIIFSIKSGASTYKQLGTINITGRKLNVLTLFDADVINPKYHGDFYPHTTMSTRAGLDVFFELHNRTTKISRLVYLPVFYGNTGTVSWCNTAAYLTDSTYSRINLQTDFGSSTDTDPQTILLYEQKMPDLKRDLYEAKVDLGLPTNYCNGSNTRADGTVIYFGNTPSKAFYNLVKGVHDITKLTCMEDNSNAAFLQTVYRDADFNEIPSRLDFMDVIFKRDLSDGSGKTIAHVYDTEVETTECETNCFETEDGRPVIDINHFRDGDGRADECENPTCEQLVNSDLFGDADNDGVLNNRDNCPCEENTDQADSDSDQWGDACDIEYDECGTIDTDADGVGDLCDACQNDPDKTSLAFDNDGNGIMDSCISTNPCGTVDTDGDGTNDNCDACPNDSMLTELAYDIDGNGINDSCVATPCGTVDSDGDGVFDHCDACPNNENLTELAFDLDNDSINDACYEIVDTLIETQTVPELEPEVPNVVPQESGNPLSVGIHVGGSLFDGFAGCSLNTEATNQTQNGIWLSVMLGFAAILTQTRYKAKQRQK